MFARTTDHVRSWSARMAFFVLHTGMPIVLGMQFCHRVEPHVMWRLRKYLIYNESITNVLRADLLPRAHGPAASHLLLTNLSPANIQRRAVT